MTSRIWPTLVLLIITLIGSTAGVSASRTQQSLRDRTYISPTWGFSVRWYDDEWSIEQESTADGTDTLWLSDSMGNTVGFEGRAGHGGDARACLDELVSAVEETTDAGDATVVTDEFDRPFKIFHPWRSWIVLLVPVQADDQNQQLTTLSTSTAAR